MVSYLLYLPQGDNYLSNSQVSSVSRAARLVKPKEAGNIKGQFLFPHVEPLPLLRNHPRTFRPAREIPHALARTARDSAPGLVWCRSARRLSLGFEVSPARSAACTKR